jgi:glyoxylase-like metal-dependent hydrolase (beta-lactamase superfamily II)/rhodanese-related sulfurtransferase
MRMTTGHPTRRDSLYFQKVEYPMIFSQYYLQSLSHASYLIGDEESHLAAIVDPQRDIDQYLNDLDSNHLTLQYIFLTHFHADFLAGHLELRHRTGADIYLGSHAKASYPFHPLRHGYEIEFGSTRLTVLETPGHTPESISLVVYDLQNDPEQPTAILTGDTLFVGDVGRPDLLASFGVDSHTLAGQLYDSLHQHILTHPPHTKIFPAHGAGSLCGKHLSERLSSTLEHEQLTNDALKPMSKETFIDAVTHDQLEAPAYFSHVAFLNRREHPTLEHLLTKAYTPLTVDQVLHEKSAGAQILDVRSPKEFAMGHLCESVNIGLSGKYEMWAGSLLDRETPIILIGDFGQEREAIIRLARVGLDQIQGFLNHGMHALASTPELVRRTTRMTVTHLQEQLMMADRPHVLDVRAQHEWETRHIDDSRNIPLPHLLTRLSEIPQDHTIVVYCSSGYRSSIAVSLLEHHHYSNIVDLVGGFDAWEEAVVNPALQSAQALQEAGGRTSRERT